MHLFLRFFVIAATIMSLGGPVTAAAQTPAQRVAEAQDTGAQAEAPASEEEIKSLLATLRDPQARAALERKLELLLEAQSTGKGGDAATPADAESLTDIVSQEIDAAWSEISSISTRELLYGGLKSAGALLIATLIYFILLRIGRGMANVLRKDGEAVDNAAQQKFAESVEPGIRMVLRVLVGSALLITLAQIWGLGVGDFLPESLLPRVAETAFSILLILMFALLTWHGLRAIVGIVFNRLVSAEPSTRRSQRIRTLEPLFVSLGRFTIGALALMILLAELGMEIGPLLAGAGVVGLAIGFGAQNLVRDLLNGILLVMEDAASVGDVVDVAGHMGLVESMNMRVMVLRDLAGVVHTVPYGEITTVMNYTKEFSYAMIDVGVAYREDIGQVITELEHVGAQLREAEVSKTLDDLEILGVDALGDSAVVVKVRMRVMADERWNMERTLRRMIKDRFDEVGIEIPFPHTTLYFGADQRGKAPPAHVLLQSQTHGRKEGPPAGKDDDVTTASDHGVPDDDGDAGED